MLVLSDSKRAMPLILASPAFHRKPSSLQCKYLLMLLERSNEEVRLCRTGLALVVGKPTVYVMMMLMWALWMIKTYHACQWQAADSSCRPASVWMESNVLTRPSLSGIGRMVTYRCVKCGWSHGDKSGNPGLMLTCLDADMCRAAFVSSTWVSASIRYLCLDPPASLSFCAHTHPSHIPSSVPV